MSWATTFTNLLPGAQGSYAEAEPLYQRSLAIREKALGPEHPDLVMSLNHLAMVCCGQVRKSFVRSFTGKSLESSL